jgi:hypothetical protein
MVSGVSLTGSGGSSVSWRVLRAFHASFPCSVAWCPPHFRPHATRRGSLAFFRILAACSSSVGRHFMTYTINGRHGCAVSFPTNSTHSWCVHSSCVWTFLTTYL